MYDQGWKLTNPFFTVFLLLVERPPSSGPRIGFTTPRAFGKAVLRNRAKRRIRELLRRRLPLMDPKWDLVIHPRRPTLEASPSELEREVERLVTRCAKL